MTMFAAFRCRYKPTRVGRMLLIIAILFGVGSCTDLLNGRLVKLTNGDMIGFDPSWSPDGQLLIAHVGKLTPYESVGVYSFQKESFETLYAYIFGEPIQFGQPVDKLFLGPDSPTWSVSSSLIVLRGGDANLSKLWVLDTDSGEGFELASALRISDPDWSPDDRFIVYSASESLASTTQDIYQVEVASGEVTAITSDAYRYLSPKWSPSGDKIAMLSNRDGDFDLYWMNSNGGDIEKLLDGDIGGIFWYPDGSAIGFTMGEGRATEVYALDLATRTTHRVTRNRLEEVSLDISPDGTRLAFASNTRGRHEFDYDIYVVEFR